MAKATGLDTRIYAEGIDLSGDVSALTGIGSTQNLLDVTTLDLSATARLAGLRDGNLSCSAFFDNAASKGHDTWTSLSGKIPTADQNVMVPLSQTIGEPVLMTVAKQGTYYVDRPSGGPISCSVDYQAANGTSPDMGVLLTAGVASANTTASYTAIDNSASSSGGARGMVQVTALTSGTANLLIEDSPDDVTYSTLIAFTSATGVTSEAKSVSGTVERYVRFTIQDAVGFSGCQFIVGVIRL